MVQGFADGDLSPQSPPFEGYKTKQRSAGDGAAQAGLHGQMEAGAPPKAPARELLGARLQSFAPSPCSCAAVLVFLIFFFF